jgi:cysteine desulfurase
MNNPDTVIMPTDDKKFVRQMRPIIAVDATQSITKLPIDMQKWGINAVFFSLHKLGGPMGFGVLVISDMNEQEYCPVFKPLIAGYQQLGLRGGTWDMEEFVNVYRCIKDNDEKNKRKNKWVEGYDKLEELGLKVVKPDKNHMYNTYLIEVPGCPLGVINALAQEGIYVGNASSCSNEAITDKNMEERARLYGPDELLEGGAVKRKHEQESSKRYIRLSFNKSTDFNMETLEKIADMLNMMHEH